MNLPSQSPCLWCLGSDRMGFGAAGKGNYLTRKTTCNRTKERDISCLIISCSSRAINLLKNNLSLPHLLQKQGQNILFGLKTKGKDC